MIESDCLMHVHLDSVDSTNNWLKANADGRPNGFAVTARSQVAGRGQRGNSWESAPGRNVTMSMLLRPDRVDAARQFVISEAVALGVVDTLRHFLGSEASAVAVKWPNDIYWNDKKICGILIENVLRGREITQSVAGMGLNVNQTEFLSDAPNPVSMWQITGREFSVGDVAEVLRRNIISRSKLPDETSMKQLHCEYLNTLWRRDGFHPYRDAASQRRFMARITGISPSGMLSLEEPDGSAHVYAFKEVQAIVEDMPL